MRRLVFALLVVGAACGGSDEREAAPEAAPPQSPPRHVRIEGGAVDLGAPGDTFTKVADDSPSRRTVELATYFIDRDPVTNAEYLTCIRAGACPKECQALERCRGHVFDEYHVDDPELGAYPVATATIDGAEAYCRWRGARLPTEAEWERAARGPNSSKFPWGNEPSAPFPVAVRPRKWRHTWSRTVSDAQQDISAEGVRHMVTGVPELVADVYEADPSSAPGFCPSCSHVVRGNLTWGGVLSGRDEYPLPAWARGEARVGGFRCAWTENESRPSDEFFETRRKLLAGEGGGQ